jgi:hypothetical protein
MGGHPLGNAAVLSPVGGVGSITLGYSDSGGCVSITDSGLKGRYEVKAVWEDSIMYSQEVTVDDEATGIDSEAYNLTVRVNFLGLIPTRNARISIVEKDSGVLVESYEGPLDLPYGLYRLSAEKTFRLPRGNYIVKVESLNPEEKVLTIDGNLTVDFTRVVSLESALVLGSVLVAALSLTCFLIVARKSNVPRD